jgi:tRNA (mo5U34)-methyltransferase
MTDFGQLSISLIATGPLARWLETLPAQLAAWQKEQQHGLFKAVAPTQ